MNKQPGILKLVVLAIPVAIVFAFLTVFLWDQIRSSSFAGSATKVQIGDTKDDVFRIMGDPVVKFVHKDGNMFTFNNDSSGDEYWVYGPIFDFENAFFPEPPYFFPLRIRFFSAYPDDVYFRFSAENGEVKEVTLPKEAK